MNDDIVARLRWLDAVNCMDNDHLHDGLIIEAADEIERLRELSGDAGKLRAERDEARRAVCCGALPPEYRGWGQEAVDLALKAIAKQQGWDCYKEATDGK